MPSYIVKSLFALPQLACQRCVEITYHRSSLGERPDHVDINIAALSLIINVMPFG
ncbi:hypothetical protein [Coralloluteibacterium stylophorae]|uniref:hypothetical protein n=1 Tax=Coralloluteibacterium stylophorae TaxID=1776034 RepID=UPI001FEB0DD1|nr:hypothetical protein [Coralloluteibacterium stylophorae]